MTWALEFKARSNDKARRSEYFDVIKPAITNANEQHSIDENYANNEILVEVFRDVLVFAILKEYKTRKKYNFMQL